MSAAADRRLEEQALLSRLTPELRRQLVSIARAVGCTPTAAEDAAQEAMVKLTRKPHALMPENVGLMRRIARDCAKDVQRSAQRHETGGFRHVSFEDWLPEHEGDEWSPDYDPD